MVSRRRFGSMCQDIERRRSPGIEFDFVVVTGDIAFSGKPQEYELAGVFFAELAKVAGVPRQRIFCVPGNHDVDRARQEYCFKGARAELTNATKVDALLGGGDNLNTLMERQASYFEFQADFFAGQNRTATEDQLGYVSLIDIDAIRVAIVGINSAWLAQGGTDDNGNLIVGERHIINAIKTVERGARVPHITIVLAHHPFSWLRDFDGRPVQELVYEKADFFHCGHLHEPATSVVKSGGTDCLTVAAGAAFESRAFHNSYSITTLDPLHALRSIQVLRYIPETRRFVENETRKLLHSYQTYSGMEHCRPS